MKIKRKFIIIEDEVKGSQILSRQCKRIFHRFGKSQGNGIWCRMGIPNMKANSDILDIKSEVNKGTIVEIINFY